MQRSPTILRTAVSLRTSADGSSEPMVILTALTPDRDKGSHLVLQHTHVFRCPPHVTTDCANRDLISQLAEQVGDGNAEAVAQHVPKG